MSDQVVRVKIYQQKDYRFESEFGDRIPTIVGDEPQPLGTGLGPSPVQLLCTAVGNCLASSLLFAFRKFKQDPDPLQCEVLASVGKNADNRLRVLSMKARITLGVATSAPELLALSHVWKTRDQSEYMVAAKGAPEAIADLCHLNPQQLAELTMQINSLAANGMRVLGVARAIHQGNSWPDVQHDFDFEFIGLIGLSDPIRPNVAPALQECIAAGIRVVMITGDYPVTAAAIAAQIGLTPGSGGVISGAELSNMDDTTLRERVRHSNIFARMVPTQKLRLVNALKANGEVVVMTGDGVNDAPALKAAHVGIAMGRHGTDVARESAALVLLDDDFASIMHAVRMGRIIFDNLRKGMAYIFSVHIPIVGLSLIPLLLGWAPIFAPVHIVFLEMIINPACSIVFEAEPAEANIMRRPPRPTKEPLFGKRVLLISLMQGTVLLLVTLMILSYSKSLGLTDSVARAMIFTTLVIGNLGLILVNRSWQRVTLHVLDNRNPALWWIVGGALAFLFMTLTLPSLYEMFHFSSLSWQQLTLCVLAGLGSVAWFELYKVFHRAHAIHT